MRIFLIDDDDIILALIKGLLKGTYSGANVSQFTHSSEYIRRLEEKPDVAIIDYHLNETNDGLDLIKITKEVSPNTIIIMLSAQMEDSSVVHSSIRNGASYYFIKDNEGYELLSNRIKELADKIRSEPG